MILVRVSKSILVPLVLALLSIAVVLGGCGGSSTTTSAGGAASSTVSSTAITAPSPGSTSAAVTAGGAKVIKVGAVAPMSGGLAQLGQDLMRSVHIAFDEVNAAGGINGANVEIVEADDANDPSQATTVAQRLAGDSQIVAVIAGETSGPAMAASSVYASVGLGMLCATATNPQVTDRGLNNIVRTSSRDDQQGAFDAKFIIEQLKPQRLYILDDKSAAGAALADGVVNALKAAGVNVVAHDSYVSGQKDFTSLVTRVKQANPDVIFGSINTPSEGVLILKQAKTVGLTATWVGPDSLFDDTEYIKSANGVTEGMYVSFNIPDFSSDPAASGFIKKYTEQYKSPPGTYGPLTYAAGQIMADALKRAAANGELTRASVLEALKTTNMPANGSLLNVPISFDQKGDLKSAKFYMFQVKGGKFVQITK